MTATEHYWKAQRLLDHARDVADSPKCEYDDSSIPPLPSDAEMEIRRAMRRDAYTHAALFTAQAQVHATLALAAATALATTYRHVGDSQEVTDWAQIAQPEALKREPCTDGCVDEGRNGCYRPCVEAKAKRAAEPSNYEECPF